MCNCNWQKILGILMHSSSYCCSAS